jgi:hypothetical protein
MGSRLTTAIPGWCDRCLRPKPKHLTLNPLAHLCHSREVRQTLIKLDWIDLAIKINVEVLEGSIGVGHLHPRGFRI